VGVLAIREPGSPDYASLGLQPGEGFPRVVTAGRFLALPGGYFPRLAREIAEGDLPTAALEELRVSGGWVKVIGDHPGPDGRFRRHWTPETLRVTAAAIHRAGGRLAVHAVSAPAVEAAVEAGFDSIEHGVEMTDGAIQAMAQRAIAWVPTLAPGAGRVAAEFALSIGLPRATVEWIRTTFDRQSEMVGRAARAGVRILAGTDAGQGPHGMIVEQVKLLVEAGLRVEQALGAASWDARAFLGLRGLTEGAPADLVIYDEDPRERIDALERPALIMLDGRLIASHR
jgi:imidazolonepropionase-like amidohydrolase